MTNGDPADIPGKPRRPPPTLDLTATEVGGAESTTTGSEDPRAESAPAGRKASALLGAIPWLAFGAGCAGGAIACALAWLLFGLGAGSQDSGSANLDGRLAQVEAQLRDRPLAVDPKRVDDLTNRVTALEATSAPPRAATDAARANRLGALEDTVKTFDQNIADLNRRGDEINGAMRDLRDRIDANTAALAEIKKQQGGADPAVVEALTGRIAALEGSARSLTPEIARQIADAADRPARLAVGAAALRDAVERGDPFVAELAALKTLGADPKSLATLEPFAPAGVPQAAALAREFSALGPALHNAAGSAPVEGGFLDRLQANAEKLVRIHPVDAVVGDDPAAIIGRADARAALGDLTAILAELAKLPAGVRAPAEAWIVKVQARDAAVGASRQFARDALAALSKASR